MKLASNVTMWFSDTRMIEVPINTVEKCWRWTLYRIDGERNTGGGTTEQALTIMHTQDIPLDAKIKVDLTDAVTGAPTQATRNGASKVVELDAGRYVSRVVKIDANDKEIPGTEDMTVEEVIFKTTMMITAAENIQMNIGATQ